MLAMKKDLTAEQRVAKAVSDIVSKDQYRWLAGVMMVGSREVRDDMPTACTNGRDEIYGRAFVDSLNDAELRFLVLHENYHKLYKHLTMWDYLWKKNPRRANIACDRCINLRLVNENTDGFAKMPTCPDTGKVIGAIDHTDRGLNELQIWKKLEEEEKDNPTGGGGSCNDGDPGDGQGAGLDEHDWEGAQELTEQEKNELAKELDEAVRQGALMAGKTGSGGDRNLEDLLRPVVDWREVLREFITTTCAGKDYSTWKRPNRRFLSAGVYMPSGISERVDELVLAIDTSGSIGTHELQRFLSEVAGIAESVKPERVRLLYWDTAVCREEKYEHHELANIAKSTKPAGGGGTAVECVPPYMQEHKISPQAVIVLTDGYLGSWASWSCPVLWCIIDNRTTTPSVGKTVHIDTSTL